MILVNTKDTYTSVANRLAAGEDCWAELERITTGDWPPLSQKNLQAYADYLVGSDAGIVTVVYRIRDVEVVKVPRRGVKPGEPVQLVDKLRFTVEPAPEMTWLVGTDQPDGPWRKGEARGTRRIGTPTRRSSSTLQEWERAARSAARRAIPAPAQSGVPLVDSATGIEVSRADDGALVVTIPAETAQAVLAGGLLHTMTPASP